MGGSAAMRTLEDTKATLQEILPDLQQRYSVRSLGVFGSYVRGEHTPYSDLDILVEFDPNARFGLLKFCELENYLSDQLGLRVDLVEKSALKPVIGQRILREVLPL
jgi:predicted nucleotidyltransferase